MRAIAERYRRATAWRSCLRSGEESLEARSPFALRSLCLRSGLLTSARRWHGAEQSGARRKGNVAQKGSPPLVVASREREALIALLKTAVVTPDGMLVRGSSEKRTNTEQMRKDQTSELREETHHPLTPDGTPVPKRRKP